MCLDFLNQYSQTQGHLGFEPKTFLLPAKLDHAYSTLKNRGLKSGFQQHLSPPPRVIASHFCDLVYLHLHKKQTILELAWTVPNTTQVWFAGAH